MIKITLITILNQCFFSKLFKVDTIVLSLFPQLKNDKRYFNHSRIGIMAYSRNLSIHYQHQSINLMEKNSLNIDNIKKNSESSLSFRCLHLSFTRAGT